jgi:hypothetical protein
VILAGWLTVCTGIGVSPNMLPINGIQLPLSDVYGLPAAGPYYEMTPLGPRLCHRMGSYAAVCED